METLLRNDRGLSIAEALIATSLTAIVMLGVSSTVSSQLKVFSHIEAKTEVNAYKQHLQSYLNKAVNCTQTIQSPMIETLNNGVSVKKIQVTAPNDPTKFINLVSIEDNAKAYIPNTSIEIEDFIYEKNSSTPTPDDYHIRVDLKTQKGKFAIKDITIPILTTTDGTYITGCVATNGGGSGGGLTGPLIPKCENDEVLKTNSLGELYCEGLARTLANVCPNGKFPVPDENDPDDFNCERMATQASLEELKKEIMAAIAISTILGAAR